MDKNRQHKDRYRVLFWSYVSGPLIKVILCVFFGIVMPIIAHVTAKNRYIYSDAQAFFYNILNTIDTIAFLMLIPSIMHLANSIETAKDDPNRELIYAQVEKVEEKQDGGFRSYIVTCRGDDGKIYTAEEYHSRTPELTGKLIPLRVSRIFPDTCSIDTDMIVWDLDPAEVKPEPYVPTPSAPSDYGHVTWTWDESGTERKTESKD